MSWSPWSLLGREAGVATAGRSYFCRIVVVWFGICLGAFGIFVSSTSAADPGSISGAVTDASGVPLENICVDSFDSGGFPSSVARTDASGGYMVGGLLTDNYRLEFYDCGTNNVLYEYYNDKSTLAAADPIPVTWDSATTGINVQMATDPNLPDGGSRDGNSRDGNSPDNAVYKAKIGKVKVSGPAKVKKGEKATYKVKISNTGSAEATGIRLKVSGKGVNFNTSVGKIAPAKTRTVKLKLKPQKSGKVKVSFKLTSENAGGKTVNKTITVKD